jgi:hypothetical protein
MVSSVWFLSLMSLSSRNSSVPSSSSVGRQLICSAVGVLIVKLKLNFGSVTLCLASYCIGMPSCGKSVQKGSSWLCLVLEMCPFVLDSFRQNDSRMDVMNARSAPSRPSSPWLSRRASSSSGCCCQSISHLSLSKSGVPCHSSSSLCSLRNSSISHSWAHSGSVSASRRFRSIW